jgi:hypothetical protein
MEKAHQLLTPRSALTRQRYIHKNHSFAHTVQGDKSMKIKSLYKVWGWNKTDAFILFLNASVVDVYNALVQISEQVHSHCS